MALTIGALMAPFSLRNVDGKTILSEMLTHQAKGLAVIFSCNHCPYVHAWEDRMIQLGMAAAGQGIPFVLINANDARRYPEDSFDAMVARAATKRYPFVYLHDEDQKVARAYGATRTPEVFLFNKDLRLCYHGSIDDNHERPDAVRSHHLKEAIGAVVAGLAPAVTQTPLVGCSIKWKPS